MVIAIVFFLLKIKILIHLTQIVKVRIVIRMIFVMYVLTGILENGWFLKLLIFT